MRGDNIALLTHRPHSSPSGFTFVYSTRMIGDQCVAANKSIGGGNSFQFPLYAYDSEPDTGDQQMALGLPMSPDTRQPNIHPDFISEAERNLGLRFVRDGRGDLADTLGPEDIFFYIYAVLHSPAYRERYAQFLRREFPRIPFTSSPQVFRKLVEKGAELIAVHVMESPLLGEVFVRFPVPGSNEVDVVRFSESEQRVWINRTQYFEGIAGELWLFSVGGYQVCDRWLKDRKGRKVSYQDVSHFQKMVTAIKETMRLMSEIDAIIPSWPIN